MMSFKLGFILVTLVLGSCALPLQDESDLHKYFSEGRVVGGVEAADGSVPYMAALVHGLMVATFQCGGSLITTRHVLSAAHCFDRLYSNGQLTPTLRAVVGSNRWNLGGQAYSIERNISHPKHIYVRDPLNVEYDIGLLVTSREVVLSDRVQLVPVSLEPVGAGVVGRTAGWGRIYGDSGSALVRADTGEQVGVVSWGLPCARGAPDVFVKISGFKDWLRENLVL